MSKGVKDQVEKDPEVARSYEDYVKRGTYNGMVIWE